MVVGHEHFDLGKNDFHNGSRTAQIHVDLHVRTSPSSDSCSEEYISHDYLASHTHRKVEGVACEARVLNRTTWSRKVSRKRFVMALLTVLCVEEWYNGRSNSADCNLGNLGINVCRVDFLFLYCGTCTRFQYCFHTLQWWLAAT